MVLAGRTRDMTSRLNAITMPEFLSARYGNKPLQVVAALVVFVLPRPLLRLRVDGFEYLFEMTLHIPYENALYFLTALTAVYLVMGGYFAVAVSDFIRGIVEFAGVLVMVYLLAHRPETGGFVNATSLLLSDPSAAPGLAVVKQLGAGKLAGRERAGLADAAGAGVDHQLRSVGAAADGAEVLFHPQHGRREACHGHRHRLRAVHVVWRVLQRSIDASVLRPEAAAGIDGSQRPDLGQNHAAIHHHLRSAGAAGAHHRADGFFRLDVEPVIAGAGFPVRPSRLNIYGAFVNRHANQKQTMALLRVLCAVFVDARCSLPSETHLHR